MAREMLSASEDRFTAVGASFVRHCGSLEVGYSPVTLDAGGLRRQVRVACPCEWMWAAWVWLVLASGLYLSGCGLSLRGCGLSLRLACPCKWLWLCGSRSVHLASSIASNEFHTPPPFFSP